MPHDWWIQFTIRDTVTLPTPHSGVTSAMVATVLSPFGIEA
jgi:hypothetical protein